MRKLALILIIAIPQMALASWPSKCVAPLENLFSTLQEKGELIKPSDIRPDENYIEEGRPRSCLVKTKLPYNWFIEMHKNNVTVIIHRYEFKTMKSVYYGPYQSAYNK